MDEAPYFWSTMIHIFVHWSIGCRVLLRWLRELRHRGRDPRDQIEELEDANDKLSRAGDSQLRRSLRRSLKSSWKTLESFGYFWYVTWMKCINKRLWKICSRNSPCAKATDRVERRLAELETSRCSVYLQLADFPELPHVELGATICHMLF